MGLARIGRQLLQHVTKTANEDGRKESMKTIKEPVEGQATRLNDLPIEDYLKDAIQIVPEALEEEFIRVPADIAYWNERHSVALRQHLEAKIERERIQGELLTDPEFAEELEARLGKKPTVDQLKGGMTTSRRYITARLAEASAEAERARLRGCVEAVASKRDMLISLGAHVRLEMQHDPVLRSRMAGLRDMAEHNEDSNDE